jgi:hypothetical protein
MATATSFIMKRKRSQIGRSPILSDRIRRIDGGFCFVPHRFLRDGFCASLTQHELLLYFLLVLAGDRNGVSFYHSDSLCTLLALQVDEYVAARNRLIAKDLLAFDGTRFQVLSLPARPIPVAERPLSTEEDFEEHDPATIRQIIRRSLGMDDQEER